MRSAKSSLSTQKRKSQEVLQDHSISSIKLLRIDTPRRRQDSSKRRDWEPLIVRAGWVLLVGLMIGIAPIALNRGIKNMGGTDFPEYYKAGRYLLEHRAIQPNAMTAYYLPSVDVLWAGIAWFPLPVAAVLWYAIGCYAWLKVLSACHNYLLSEVPERDRRHSVIAVGLLVVPLVLDQLCIGAFHGIMLWWMVAGMGRILRGQRWTGAALLGLAIWIKLLPALGAAYLLYKRRWREAMLAGLVALVVDLGLTALALPFAANVQAHKEWLHKDAVGTAELLLSSSKVVNEQRVTNQSLPAVLRRILTELGYGSGKNRDLARIANLSSAQLKFVYYGFLALLGGAIAWYCRRSAKNTPVEDQATELALVILSTLWFSPIAPSYHPIVVAPALALIIGRNNFRPLGWGAVGLWSVAMALHGFPTARAFGHILWMTLILGGLLVWKTQRFRQSLPALSTS